jgi:hypothetical protein
MLGIFGVPRRHQPGSAGSTDPEAAHQPAPESERGPELEQALAAKTGQA